MKHRIIIYIFIIFIICLYLGWNKHPEDELNNQISSNSISVLLFYNSSCSGSIGSTRQIKYLDNKIDFNKAIIVRVGGESMENLDPSFRMKFVKETMIGFGNCPLQPINKWYLTYWLKSNLKFKNDSQFKRAALRWPLVIVVDSTKSVIDVDPRDLTNYFPIDTSYRLK